jgi:hypothetical protein
VPLLVVVCESLLVFLGLAKGIVDTKYEYNGTNNIVKGAIHLSMHNVLAMMMILMNFVVEVSIFCNGCIRTIILLVHKQQKNLSPTITTGPSCSLATAQSVSKGKKCPALPSVTTFDHLWRQRTSWSENGHDDT